MNGPSDHPFCQSLGAPSLGRGRTKYRKVPHTAVLPGPDLTLRQGPLKFLRPGVGDLCGDEFECNQSGEWDQVLEPGVGDLRAPEVERGQVRERCEFLHAGVGDCRAAKDQGEPVRASRKAARIGYTANSVAGCHLQMSARRPGQPGRRLFPKMC